MERRESLAELPAYQRLPIVAFHVVMLFIGYEITAHIIKAIFS